MSGRGRGDNLELLREINLKQQRVIFLKDKSLFHLRTVAVPLRDFAKIVDITVPLLIARSFTKGKVLNINQDLNSEEIRFLCELNNLSYNNIEERSSDLFSSINLVERADDLRPRPPIVAFMGHVDHGKTTLLDHIRKTKVVKSEAGGITQRCAAYQAQTSEGAITFIDTPGHEAFRAMRQRGAQLTDIIVLVVAADEPLKPQTKEAVEHARFASVPLIVFLNKVDKPQADTERITAELASLDLYPDSLGGNTPFIKGSGLTGEGVESLLEAILVQAQLNGVSANSDRYAIGTILECSFERGKGAVATLIVRSGTLALRDMIVYGGEFAKVRSLTTIQGDELKLAIPSTPCLVSGFSGCPTPGTSFFAVKDETAAKELIKSDLLPREISSLEEVSDRGLKRLNLIIRSDNQGTAEALRMSVAPLANSEVQVKILKVSSGELTQADVLLAKTSQGRIICFATKPTNDAKLLARSESVEIYYANVIYEVIDRVKAWLKQLKTPIYRDNYCGEAQVIKLFYYSKVGSIAGCSVQDGYVVAEAIVEVWRKEKLVFKGKLESLRREANNVKRVEKGHEFGTHIKDFNDVLVGDRLRFFEKVLVEDDE